jgi:hypothetical protein
MSKSDYCVNFIGDATSNHLYIACMQRGIVKAIDCVQCAAHKSSKARLTAGRGITYEQKTSKKGV